MRVTIQRPDGQREPADLTTDHATSTYGVPVVVLPNGAALGPGECLILSASPATDSYAKRGRYTVERPTKLAAARMDTGRSRADLAAAAGVTEATLAALEWGEQSPTLQTAKKIAAALGREVGEIF
jgi:DNA-binding XRE family transcriptional regulator